MLTRGATRPGTHAPKLLVLKVGPSPGRIDDIAKGMLANARRRHPNQGGIDKMDRTRLDGADAWRVQYLLQVNEVTFQVEAVVSSHGAYVYVLQFLAPQKEFADCAPEARQIVQTFRWSRT